MGVPFCVFSTVFPISCTLSKSPMERTLTCCRPCWMKLPPAFTLLLVSCCSTSPMLRPYSTSLFGIDGHLVFLGDAAEAD